VFRKSGRKKGRFTGQFENGSKRVEGLTQAVAGAGGRGFRPESAGKKRPIEALCRLHPEKGQKSQMLPVKPDGLALRQNPGRAEEPEVEHGRGSFDCIR